MATPTNPEPGDIILKTDTRGRVRVDRERREAILAEFDRSAMSAAAFARLHGIKYTTFNYWLKVRRERQAPSGAALVEAVVDPGGGALQVELPCGARLQVHDEASAGLAATLLRAL